MKPLKPPVAPQKSSASSRANDVVDARWMRHDYGNERQLDANELVSLEVMAVYVARMSQQHPFSVERKVADHFNVPNIKCLPASLYTNAVHFMIAQLPVSKAA